ncbi:hypothetical protein [Archangium sp.]|jgi:hypothetical protein|uniref:hypothetical protein n=1 Tax=Archangium sp. TaxID=1872627 RepID=UPI002ED91B22
MQKRIVPPNVEVQGQSIIAVVGGLQLLKNKALRLLAENGIQTLEPLGWYPLRDALAAIHSIHEKIGPSTLRAVGRQVPEHIRFSPEVRTLEQALRALDAAYQQNHRGQVGGNIGGYRLESVSARSARLVCDNPYPCDFDQGILEALCERFRPKDSVWMRVEHGAHGCRQQSGFACTYHVTW